MSYLTDKGVTVIQPFKVDAPTLLDTRGSVTDQAELESIVTDGHAAAGMVSLVTDKNTLKVYTGAPGAPFDTILTNTHVQGSGAVSVATDTGSGVTTIGLSDATEDTSGAMSAADKRALNTLVSSHIESMISSKILCYTDEIPDDAIEAAIKLLDNGTPLPA